MWARVPSLLDMYCNLSGGSMFARSCLPSNAGGVISMDLPVSRQVSVHLISLLVFSVVAGSSVAVSVC